MKLFRHGRGADCVEYDYCVFNLEPYVVCFYTEHKSIDHSVGIMDFLCIKYCIQIMQNT